MTARCALVVADARAAAASARRAGADAQSIAFLMNSAMPLMLGDDTRARSYFAAHGHGRRAESRCRHARAVRIKKRQTYY